jgi:hypothetical protein
MVRQTAGISRREALVMSLAGSLAVSWIVCGIAIAASTLNTPLHIMKPALLPPFQGVPLHHRQPSSFRMVADVMPGHPPMIIYNPDYG